MPLDFLAIGHVSLDTAADTPEGWRLGGTAAFAAVVATRLGLKAGIVTSSGSDLPLSSLLPEIDITNLPATESTRFENRYDGGIRLQWVRGRAAFIGGCSIPDSWTHAKIVLVGPIIDEVSTTLPQRFPGSSVGICLQGWLRRIDDQSRVQTALAEEYNPVQAYPNATAIFVSNEDLATSGNQGCILERWTHGRTSGPIVALTKGNQGAEIWNAGQTRRIPAFPAQERDATGAGDVFAAAFLIRLSETGAIEEAARFAGAAAALSTAGPGLAYVPDRAAIHQVLNDHPEVRLQ